MPERNGGWQDRIDRRTYLRGAGVAGALALAGCTGGDGGGDGDDTPTDEPAGDGDGDGGTPTDTPSGGDGDGMDDGDGGTTEQSGGTLTMGALQPFTGGYDWIAANTEPAYKLAAKQIEAEGLLGGMSIEFNDQDTAVDPQQAVSGLKTLEAAGVPAIIGPSSSVMPNLVQPIQNLKQPLITVMAGTIQLDDVGGTWLWRDVPSDAVGGAAAGKYIYEELGHRELALTFKNDKGSQSFAASVGEAFKAKGGEVVGSVPLPINASDYRSEIQKLQQMEPDFVQMTAGAEVSTLFVKNYEELGAKEDFNLALGNDVLTESFLETVGADVAEGFVGQSPAPGPAYDAFASDFKSMHGSEPGAFSPEGYDAMNLFALAFQSAGEVSRDVVPKELPYIANPPGTEVTTFAEGKAELEAGNDINYIGAGNPQNFDEKGNVVGPFSVLVAEDGAWNSVITYEAEKLQKVY